MRGVNSRELLAVKWRPAAQKVPRFLRVSRHSGTIGKAKRRTVPPHSKNQISTCKKPPRNFATRHPSRADADSHPASGHAQGEIPFPPFAPGFDAIPGIVAEASAAMEAAGQALGCSKP